MPKRSLTLLGTLLAPRTNTPAPLWPRFFTVFLLSIAAQAFAADPNLPAPLSESEKNLAAQINALFHRAAQQVQPAVVYLQVSKIVENSPLASPIPAKGLGSGCIIDKRGYIITNNHVVADTDKVEVVLADGHRFTALEKLVDPATDLAVVRIDPNGHNLPVALFGNSDKTQVGDFVLAMGSPFGLEQTVTAGIISYKGRQTHILGPWGLEDFIQTDAVINRGNSGGPLVSLYGEIIGINSNILTPTSASAGYGFAVPSKIVKDVVQQLIEKKQVRRGWLGITMIGVSDLKNVPADQLENPLGKDLTRLRQTIPPDLIGVVVIDVLPDSPSLAAGIKQNDVILELNGQKVASSKQLRDIIAAMPPGATVHCLIWRQNKQETHDVILGDRNLAQAAAQREIIQDEISPDQDRNLEPPLANPEPPAAAKPAKLGVAVQPLTPETARQYGYDENISGIVITYVQPDSLAHQSGLLVGDIILSIDGQNINSADQLKSLVDKADTNAGFEIRIRNRRGEHTHLIKRGPD